MATSGQRDNPAPSGRAVGDRVVRSALLALVTYALGLIPFYLLTPVHEALPSLLRSSAGPSPTVVASPRPAGAPTSSPAPTASPNPSASPSQQDAQKKIGADVAPVVAPNDTAATAPAASPTAPTADSRYAFLLLGYGGAGHDGAYLTDSMMVVVVDPGHRTLTLLSIPRDSWVPLQFDGRSSVYEKINTAYAFAQDPTLYPDRLDKYTGPTGPGTFASDTVSRLLGIPIRYYLGLDFQGFRDMINAVGGVDVVVPDSFSAQYPANDNSSINAGWMTVSFRQGPEHMDGERAIEFARAREVLDNPSEASDFARSRRQRLIMEAFKARLFQPGGLIHLPQLISIATSHVDTNYSVPDVAQLSQLALDWKSVKIYQTALTIQNYLEEGTGPDGTYLVVPSSPDHSWAQIEAFTQRLWTDPEVGVAMASTSVLVENDSGVPGAGTRLSADLLKLGYNVIEPVAGPIRTQSQIVDRTASGASPLVHQLNADFGKTFDVTTEAPAAGADDQVVVQLGSDDADMSLATVVPDLSAPFSIVGVTNFGAWVPVSSSAAPAVAPGPARTTRSPIRGTAVAASGSPTGSLTPRPTSPSPSVSAGPETTETPVPVGTASPASSPVSSGATEGTTPVGSPSPPSAGSATPAPPGAPATPPVAASPVPPPASPTALATSTRGPTPPAGSPTPPARSPTPRPTASPTVKH